MLWSFKFKTCSRLTCKRIQTVFTTQFPQTVLRQNHSIERIFPNIMHQEQLKILMTSGKFDWFYVVRTVSFPRLGVLLLLQWIDRRRRLPSTSSSSLIFLKIDHIRSTRQQCGFLTALIKPKSIKNKSLVKIEKLTTTERQGFSEGKDTDAGFLSRSLLLCMSGVPNWVLVKKRFLIYSVLLISGVYTKSHRTLGKLMNIHHSTVSADFQMFQKCITMDLRPGAGQKVVTTRKKKLRDGWLLITSFI